MIKRVCDRATVPGATLTAAGVAAGVLSFDALTDLARDVGVAGWSAWMLPVAVDALAVSAWWWHRRGDKASERVAIGVTAVSMLGNAVALLVSQGYLSVNRVIVGACAVIPPVSVAVCVWLQRHNTLQVAARSKVPSRSAKAVPVPAPLVAPGKARPPKSSSGAVQSPVAAPLDSAPLRGTAAPAPAQGGGEAGSGTPGRAGVVAADTDVLVACRKFGLAPERAGEVLAVVEMGRRDDVRAYRPLKDRYRCPDAVARAANLLLRSEVAA